MKKTLLILLSLVPFFAISQTTVTELHGFYFCDETGQNILVCIEFERDGILKDSCLNINTSEIYSYYRHFADMIEAITTDTIHKCYYQDYEFSKDGTRRFVVQDTNQLNPTYWTILRDSTDYQSAKVKHPVLCTDQEKIDSMILMEDSLKTIILSKL